MNVPERLGTIAVVLVLLPLWLGPSVWELWKAVKPDRKQKREPRDE
jgi:hypothetical protein